MFVELHETMKGVVVIGRVSMCSWNISIKISPDKYLKYNLDARGIIWKRTVAAGQVAVVKTKRGW